MKAAPFIFFLILLTACNNANSSKANAAKTVATITPDSNTTPPKPIFSWAKTSVLVLPSYDEIAGAGISPDVQKFLECEIAKDTNLLVIKFPYGRLMNVPYQNVFDKKYCGSIVERVKAHIVVMSKLDQVGRTGYMNADKWNLRIRVYHVGTGVQINSKVTADSLSGEEIKRMLAVKMPVLVTEIENN